MKVQFYYSTPFTIHNRLAQLDNLEAIKPIVATLDNEDWRRIQIKKHDHKTAPVKTHTSSLINKKPYRSFLTQQA